MGKKKNVGELNGLWKMIDNERAKEDATFPMLKSVWAVYSSALAYHDLCKNVSEVRRHSDTKSFCQLLVFPCVSSSYGRA